MAVVAEQLQVALAVLAANDDRYNVIDLTAQLACDLALACGVLAVITGSARNTILDTIRNRSVVGATNPFWYFSTHVYRHITIATSIFRSVFE